jgi:PAS domain S-box-containing protein
MKEPSDRFPSHGSLRDRLLGLGEKATRKSYYPQLLRQLDELERQREELVEKNRVMTQILLDLDRERQRATESEAKLSKIFRSSSQLIAVLTLADARFMEISDSWMSFLGRRREEIIGQSMNDLGLWDSLKEWERILDDLHAEGEIQGMEIQLCRPSGETFHGLLSVTPMELDRAQCVVMEITDITARKRAEEERLELERRLLHHQKIESLGMLAGGIAHDFNNLLMAIQGNVELAMVDSSHIPSVEGRLHRAIAATQRAAELVKQILTCSGESPSRLAPVQVNQLVEENMHLLQAGMLSNITLQFHPARDLPVIQADVGQMQQVLMNLVLNGCEAIGDEVGTVTVSTGWMECSDGYLKQSRLDEKPDAGPFLFIEVSDTGTGMGESTLNRIFDPFFTTKFIGRGLGMSAVLGIVRNHRGAIIIESATDQGTTVRVLFPLSGNPHPARAPWHSAEKCDQHPAVISAALRPKS